MYIVARVEGGGKGGLVLGFGHEESEEVFGDRAVAAEGHGFHC